MFRSLAALVRFMILFALMMTIVQIVSARQNYRPVHTPLIVRQIQREIP